MPIWVTEYAGFVKDGSNVLHTGSLPALRVTQYSSGSSAAASTITFLPGTGCFSISGDIAGYFVVGSSTVGVPGSTAATRVPPNASLTPFGRQVLPNNAASTLYGYST